MRLNTIEKEERIEESSGIKIYSDEQGHCTQCGRQCPLTELKCGRGERYLAQLQSGEAEADSAVTGHEHEREEHREHPRRGGRQGHHGERHGEHCGRHRHHGQNLEGYEKDLEENEDLSHLFKVCTDHIFRRGGRHNGQQKILRILDRHGEIPQRKLQVILEIQPGSLSEILSKLEERGYIERGKSEGDKRKVIVRLTEQGKAQIGEESGKKEEKDPFAVLDEQERETLKNLLKKLISASHE